MIWYYYWVPTIKKIPNTKFGLLKIIWTIFIAFYLNLGNFGVIFKSWGHYKKTPNFGILISDNAIQCYSLVKYFPSARKKDYKLFLKSCIHNHIFFNISNFYLIACQVKKTYFHLGEKCRFFGGCSRHLVG